MLFEHLTGEPAALPAGEVGILHWKVGQRVRAPGGEGQNAEIGNWSSDEDE